MTQGIRHYRNKDDRLLGAILNSLNFTSRLRSQSGKCNVIHKLRVEQTAHVIMKLKGNNYQITICK